MSLIKSVISEIDAMIARDPAARSRLEVVLCYPAFHAVMFYRLSHWLWEKGWRLVPRYISQVARFLTGVEIHPGAKIGKNLFIDHAMGVVIGETAEIGNNVTLYHDVTLGGGSPAEESDSQRQMKRHPTVEDDVIIGCGAQILGPITIGRCARVGANSVVVKNVPVGATMVGIPARVVMRQGQGEKNAFSPYGTPTGDLPDPVARAREGLMAELATLRTHVSHLEERLAEAEGHRHLPEARDDPLRSASDAP